MQKEFIKLELERIEKETGKKLFTLTEAADYLGVEVDEIEELIRIGMISCFNLGSNQRFRPIDLANFLTEGIGNNIGGYSEKPIDSGFHQRYNPPAFEEVLEVEEDEGMDEWQKGKGSVYFCKATKQWKVTISLGKDENGKRQRKTEMAKDEEDAKRKLRRMLKAYFPASEQTQPVNTNDAEEGSDISFKEFLDRFLDIKRGAQQNRTFVSNIGIAKHIEGGLGMLSMKEIDEDECERFINRFTEKTYSKGGEKYVYSKSMIHKVYVLLKRVLRDAARKGLIKRNYLDDVKEPKSKKNTEEEYKALSDLDINIIFEALEDNILLKTLIRILLSTGMRPSEALSIKYSDINFTEKTVTIKRALSFECEVNIKDKKHGKRMPIIKELKNSMNGKNKNAIRTLKLSDKTIEAIKNWQEFTNSQGDLIENKRKNNSQDFVFTGVSGNLVNYEYYLKLYTKHLKKKGLADKGYNLYRCRHTFCTKLFEMGKDIKTVMYMMGDNCMDVVAGIYNSVSKDKIIKASEDYADAFDKVVNWN